MKPVPFKLGTKALSGPRPVIPIKKLMAVKKSTDTLTYGKGIGVGTVHEERVSMGPAPKDLKLARATAAKIAKLAVSPKPLSARTKVKVAPIDEADQETVNTEDSPRIECRLRIGDLSLVVDASSLEHTLGAGRWGHGLGLVDTWPDAAWVGLLAHLKLPADPLDRMTAEQPVKRFVQRLWYEAIQGGVPEEHKAVFDTRDAEKSKEYKEDFEQVKGTSEGRKERAKTSFGRVGETHYTPTDALKAKGLKVGGQAGILLEAFKAGGFKPMTTQEATDAMVKAGLKTTTKPERIAGFYVCQWAKKGWLVRQ